MEYKVSELAAKSGVTKRTIHYYISKGLLMPPDGNGVNSSYNDSHLERILLIKNLQAQYMPLNKIREIIFEGKDIKENTPRCQSTAKQEAIEAQPITTTSIDADVYIRENICNIFEMHYSQKNGDKYKYIIENVKKYVEKMLED